MDEERLEMFNTLLVLLETFDEREIHKLIIFVQDLLTREWNECLKYDVKTVEDFFTLFNQIYEIDSTAFFKTLDEKYIAWDFVSLPNGMIAYKLSNTGRIEQKRPKDLHKRIKLLRNKRFLRDGEIG